MSKAGTYRYRNMYRYKFMRYITGTMQKYGTLRKILHVPKAPKMVKLSCPMYRSNEYSAEHVAFSRGPEHGASRPTNEPLQKNV